jgi:type IV pilus assembly protein PilW
LYPSAANAAEVQRLGKKAYYVAPTTAGEPALWRWDGAGAAQEMVEGVERLEVLFGVDANGDQEVDRYDTAQQVNQSNAWPNVISVRIAVLVRSGPGVIPTNAAQRLDADLDGAITCPDECFTDGRLRQVFTTTVALRNRLS